MKGAIKLPMAIILTNQATLNYRYGTNNETAVSNVTTAVLNGSLSITKTALSECYRANETLTYIINVKNNSSSTVTGAIINDDLGTFDIGNITVTPLTFIGPAKLFINGIENSGITTVQSNDGVIFEIDEIPQNGNAQIIYLTRVNECACNNAGSIITNTATVENGCNCACNEPSSAVATVTVCEYADLQIVKSVSPANITCDERITYTFVLNNYGNIPATEIVLHDTFEPRLKDIVVTVNGIIIPKEDYDYTCGTLTLPAEDSEYSISIPAAVCTRDEISGVITTETGSVQVTVSGIL